MTFLTSHETTPIFKQRLARTMAAALLLFAMLPVSIMGLAGYLQARSLLQQQTALQIHNISKGQIESLNASMVTKKLRLDRISRRPDFQKSAATLLQRNSDEAYQKLLDEFEAVNRPDGQPIFDDFFLVSEDGRIYAASTLSWVNTSFDIEQQIDPEGSIAIYNLEILPHQLVLLTSKPIKSLGYLVGVTKSEKIRSFLNETTFFNAESSAYLVTNLNEFIGIDPYTKELASFKPSTEQAHQIRENVDHDLRNNDVQKEIDSLLSFVNEQGVESVAQVHYITGIDGYLVLEIPRETALGQLGNLAPFSIYLIISTLVVLATILWFASNRIVKPIHKLSNTARNFSGGDLNLRSTIERQDEIGELAYSFNKMADDLSILYKSLQTQVEERTKYIRTAAEVAQSIVATFNLGELLEKTARLIAERLDYYHVGIFMVDQAGKTAVIKAAYGPAAKEMLKRKHHLDVGSASIVGWVTQHNEPRAASDVGEDPVHFKNELLPETRAEVGIPISIGDTAMGALDVQSTHPEAFDEATISVLVTLSNQIATAIQNVNLFESSDINLSEMNRLYRASRDIAQVSSREEAFETVKHILSGSPFITALIVPEEKRLRIFSVSDPDFEVARHNLPEFIEENPASITERMKHDEITVDLSKTTNFPSAFVAVLRKMGAKIISLLAVKERNEVVALILIGARHEEHLTPAALQPYSNLAETVSITLEKISASLSTERRLSELEAISLTNQAIAAAQDINSLYPALHEQVRQILGDYSFAIALYDKTTKTIHIPYLYEAGNVTSIPSFPLGEGLTSIIIKSGNPLMIVENTEKRSAALGAKLHGTPAKSWLGSPLEVNGEVIGAIIVQDTEHEHSFDESSLRFVNTLATQVSGAIHNVRLLEESKQQTIQLESAAEIARDISGSLHLDELLSKAVSMIRDRFGFYHASVFLIDALGEYAVIRESTGEAGAQLKRNGHKLRVGSKSIVGYVTSRGETLVIENTDLDATYYANPLLPNTHAEAALPLRVGERILGALDIQSTEAYAFPEEILQTLNIIADQLAVAVINTELFAETQEHLSQHRLLQHITTSAASGTTLDEALREAVQGLQVSLGGDRVSILLLDESQEELHVGAAIGYSEDDLNIVIPVGSGVTGWVAKNNKLLRVDDTQTDPRYLEVSTNTRSELAIPLVFRKDLLGVLNVESERVAAYNEGDEEMLSTLAGSLAAIIANARLLQKVRRQAEKERMLREITTKIRRSTNVQTILSTTAKELTKAVGAQRTEVRIEIEKEKRRDE